MMKKTYEEPRIIIELFTGQDIIAFSFSENPEDGSNRGPGNSVYSQAGDDS